MTEGAEAWVRDQVEREKTSQKQNQQERDANDEKNSLTERVPLPECDVGDKDDGSWQAKEQTTYHAIMDNRRAVNRNMS